MKKNEFKQYVVSRGKETQEVTITIKGAEELDEYMFPILLANMLGQASEKKKETLIANLMMVITRIAEVLDKEPFDFIMELGALELDYIGRK